MNRNGPVIVIEDDLDDQEMLADVFKKLRYENEVLFFSDGEDALSFLNNSNQIPFIILSDINLPKLDGFEIRDKIKMDAKLQLKCIPYLFLTTANNEQSVLEAYSSSAQGFFVKPNDHEALEKSIYFIMEYWKRCKSPNSFRSLKKGEL